MTSYDNELLNEFGLGDEVQDTESKRDEGLGAYVTIDVEKLLDTWRTEVSAPDILPYQGELVERIQSVLDKQTANIENLLEGEGQDLQDLYFTITLYQMDIERVRYSLARYLRTRLLKIEKCLDSITSSITLRDRLSFKEKKFADMLSSINTTYFEEQLKKRLVDKAQDFYTTDDLVHHATPDMNKYVYFKPVVDIKLVETSEDGSIIQEKQIAAGTAAIAAYGGSIKDFVLQGKVVLL